MTLKSTPMLFPPSMPWHLRLLFKLASTISDVSRSSDGHINRRLLSLVFPNVSASLRPSSAVRSADLTLKNLKVRVFTPALPPSAGDTDTPLPLVVFFHGGGFAFLSAMSPIYDAVCRRFCRKIGAVVVSVDYRLAPEHRCPAPYDDGMEVLRFLDSGEMEAEKVMAGIKLDTSSCFLMGDSAGANIAHHVARRYWLEGKKKSWERMKLAGLITIQPFFGGEERTESEVRLEGAPIVSQERTDWLWKAFLPEGAGRNHQAAHVFSHDHELGSGFPPVLLVIGGYDPLQDWQRRYHHMLKQKGKDVQLIEYPDAVHAFYVFPFHESKQLMTQILQFVADKTSSKSSKPMPT